MADCLITLDRAYTHFRVTLNVYNCGYYSGIPQPIGCQEIHWVTLDGVDQLSFPKANLRIIEALRQQGICQ